MPFMGGVKGMVMMILMLLLAGGGQALAEVSTDPPADGFYYIQNHNNSQTYYLCVSGNKYNGDAATPFVRTKQNPTLDEIWELRKDGGPVDGVQYYNIIHHADGKYLVTNNKALGAYQVVHLETIANVSALDDDARNAIKFCIKAGQASYNTPPMPPLPSFPTASTRPAGRTTPSTPTAAMATAAKATSDYGDTTTIDPRTGISSRRWESRRLHITAERMSSPSAILAPLTASPSTTPPTALFRPPRRRHRHRHSRPLTSPWSRPSPSKAV